MSKTKFHGPTEAEKAKDKALLDEIKSRRKAGKYSADDSDGQAKNTQEGGKNG